MRITNPGQTPREGPQQQPGEVYLRRVDVARRHAVSEAVITARVRRGEMPPPTRFGRKCLRWPLATIEAWERAGRPFVGRPTEQTPSADTDEQKPLAAGRLPVSDDGRRDGTGDH